MKKAKKTPAAKANRSTMEDLPPKVDPKAGFSWGATNTITDGTSNTLAIGAVSVPAVQDGFKTIK